MEQCGNLGGDVFFLGVFWGEVLEGRGNPGNLGTSGKSAGYPG